MKLKYDTANLTLSFHQCAFKMLTNLYIKHPAINISNDISACVNCLRCKTVAEEEI